MYVTFIQSMHSTKSNQNTIRKYFYSPCIMVTLKGHLLIQQNWYWFQRCCTDSNNNNNCNVKVIDNDMDTHIDGHSHRVFYGKLKQYAHNAHIRFRDSVKQHGDLKSFKHSWLLFPSVRQ